MSVRIKILLGLLAVALLLVFGYVAAAAYSAQSQVAINRHAAVATCSVGVVQMRLPGMGLPLLVGVGSRVPDGAVLNVPKGGELCLDTGNGALVRVLGPAEVDADGVARPKQVALTLRRGRLYANVHKLAADERFRISSVQAIAEVRGTRFEVDLYTRDYALNVVEGVVALTERSGLTLDVGAGRGAEQVAIGSYPLSAEVIGRVMRLSEIPAAAHKEFAASLNLFLLEGLPADNPLAPLYDTLADLLGPVKELAREGFDLGSGLAQKAGMSDPERVLQAALTLKGVRRAVVVYNNSFGVLPANLEALGEEPELFIDPWGNRFVYEIDGTLAAGFRLYSMGPDGKDGTPDDVH